MSPAPPARIWEPANDVERTLRYAWDHDDTAMYLRTLAHAPLYLPGFRPENSGDRGQRLLTRRRGEQVYLLVFTSPESLYAGLGDRADGWRLTGIAELGAAWPDERWGLAVSPTTPVGCYLGFDEVQALTELLRNEPEFHPADDREALMLGAQRSSDPGAYLDALVVSQVLVPLAAAAAPDDLGRPGFPWRVESVDGAPTISVFTSPRLLAEAVPGPVGTVRVEFVSVAAAWPDRAYRLAVNPGSAIESGFAGEQVPDLLRWAARLLNRQLSRAAGEDGAAGTGAAPATRAAPPAPPPTPRPAAPPAPRPAPEPVTAPTTGTTTGTTAGRRVVELVLDPVEVDRYLRGGYGRVSGTVREAGTGRLPADGCVLRWYAPIGEAPAGRTVRDLPLPPGARLYRLTGGTENLLATYQPELRRWMPAVADLLRGLDD